MPIVPRYNLTQSSTHLRIEVSIPHFRVSPSTLDLVIVDGTELHLQAPPTYLLKLSLPGRVVGEDLVGESLARAAAASDAAFVVWADEQLTCEKSTAPTTCIWTEEDLPKLQYNPDKNHGTLVVILRKEQGTHWQDLDSPGRLQQPSALRRVENPASQTKIARQHAATQAGGGGQQKSDDVRMLQVTARKLQEEAEEREALHGKEAAEEEAKIADLNAQIDQERKANDSLRYDVEALVKQVLHADDLLVFLGVDVEATDEDGMTALHRAIRDGQAELVEALLAKGADIEAKDKWGWTPLHRASYNNQAKVVEALLAKGADIEAKDNWGWTPLHRANYNGLMDGLRWIARRAGTETRPSSCRRASRPMRSVPTRDGSSGAPSLHITATADSAAAPVLPPVPPQADLTSIGTVDVPSAFISAIANRNVLWRVAWHGAWRMARVPTS